MLLILTHRQDATADFLCARLERDGVDYVRLDTDVLAQTTMISMRSWTAVLHSGLREVAPADVGCVWLRRPQRIAVEADDEAEAAHTSSEWGEALEGYLAQIPPERWINHPAANAAASHKLDQLLRAGQVGLLVPDTLVTQDQAMAREFFVQHNGSIIAKPLSGGYLERGSPELDTQIYTARVLGEHLDDASALRRCPTLLQEMVEKAADVRVTIVDDRITAVAMSRRGVDAQQILDIRRDNMEGVSYQKTEVPKSVTEPLMHLVRGYGLRFAAVDFAVDSSGQWIFFEINPGGQWAWLDLAGASDIAGDLVRAMQNQ